MSAEQQRVSMHNGSRTTTKTTDNNKKHNLKVQLRWVSAAIKTIAVEQDAACKQEFQSTSKKHVGILVCSAASWQVGATLAQEYLSALTLICSDTSLRCSSAKAST